jgi:hypothetical protein
MYSEKTEFKSQGSEFIAVSNCDDFDEDLWINNMDEGIQIVGARDSFRLNAIYQLLEKLSGEEPCEILVLSPNIEQKQFWDLAGIPIAQDLNQIASALRQLLQEFRKRQKPFRIFFGHPIICVIELDDLHDALASRALGLGVEYDARELNEAVAELRDFGSRVGITVITCTTKWVPFWNHCLFLGEWAIGFAETSSQSSQDVFEEINNQAYPCCFVIANDVYLMSVTDHLTPFVPRAIELVSENKRAINL